MGISVLERYPLEQSIEPSLASHPEYGPLVTRASRALDVAVERTYFPTRAVWSLNEASERHPIRVVFKDDPAGQQYVRAVRPDEIRDESDVRWAMLTLWRNVLEWRSRRLLEDILAMPSEGE